MDTNIVLVGAGSTAFGPAILSDLYLNSVLDGSTIVLHDINKEKLDMMYELLEKENEIRGNKYHIEQTLSRKKAFKGANFIINSIEVGDRFFLRWQDHEIPLKHGARTRMGECGGPGGFFHSARIIPEIVKIVQDAERICPNAFFINYSNPVARVCLAIKRTTQKLKFIGLCHQIGFLNRHIPAMLNKPLEDLKLTVVGLNHFGFLIDLEDFKSGKNYMDKFNSRVDEYFKDKWDRFEFSNLTFEVYKRFGYFPHAGDNHLVEYLQFGDQYTYIQDLKDWINKMQEEGEVVYSKALRFHKRLKVGKYTKNGMLLKTPSGERAIPIIEAILADKNSYESSVNVPNTGLVDNLPEDLVIEGPATVNEDGVHGIKIGNLPKNIAALLSIEASIQDVCVEAILKKSKDLALACLAMDPKVGSFRMAEAIYEEMTELQKDYLPKFQ
jgi:alpha-galactosidase